MVAYYVGSISVTDPEIWQSYVDQVGETIAQYGGEVMFRGVRPEVEAAAHRIVALRFANESAAKQWHDSPEYQRLVPLRDAGAIVHLVLYRGQV
jgi:uncharacterized protein (DUF1330 family)